MLGMSAVSSRMREIEGVRTVQLVHVGGLLGMGGDSLLMRLCGNLLEVGSQAKRGRKCG